MSYEGDRDRALLPACGIDYLNLQAPLVPANCPQSLKKKVESMPLSFRSIFGTPEAAFEDK